MKNANDHFGNSNGTQNYYKYQVIAMYYTDGVKDLAENCRAYWLIDLVMSYQFIPAIKREEFQVWRLLKNQDNTFIIKCTDGNEREIATQLIPLCDFPYDAATLWLSAGVLLLPCEY